MSLSGSDFNPKVKSPQLCRKSTKPITLQLLYEVNDHQQQTPKVLEGLGKATKRGIRSCPRCGMVNGTRGIKCKNGECKYDFKQLVTRGVGSSSAGNKMLASEEDIDETELCKNFRVLRILSDEKLYSVERISNVSGDANDWGFVYLPLMEEVKAIEGRDAVAYQLMAFCYMRDCISSSSSSSSSSAQTKNRKRRHIDASRQEQLCCDHVKASFLSKDSANSVCRVDPNLIDLISLPKEIKLHLSKLVCSSEINPIVQRISDSTYVVRGAQDKNHPIGYSYVFYSNQSLEEELLMPAVGEESTNHGEDFFGPMTSDKDARVCLTCWCGLKLDQDFFKDASDSPCIHLYACLLSLASDSKFSKHCYSLLTRVDEYHKQMNLFQESLLAQDIVSDPSSPGDFDKHESKLESIMDDEVLNFFRKEQQRNDRGSKHASRQNAIQGDLVKREAQSSLGHIVTDAHLPLLTLADSPSNDATAVSLPFNDWMAFVAESIEETMNYQCSGNPEPLLFHVHQKFFNVLLHRITSLSSKKKRLPDSVDTFEILPPRPPPHGTFNKYTWKLHNAGHVQQIFSTSSNKLPLYRCFIENKDGSYTKFEKPQDGGRRTSYGKPHIQPFHLKTQLKIGYDPYDLQNTTSTPFIIEWTPDLYKRSNVGEMKLTFEFSHYRHGKLMK